MMQPKKLELEYVCCGVCGAESNQQVASGKDYEYYTSEDEFKVVECQACGNLYLNPRPVQAELSTIYPPNYYAYNYDKAINPLAIRAKDWLDGMKVKQWLKYLNSPTPQFLDIGCGNGRYLEMLHRLGIPKGQLYGVEMSKSTVDQLNNKGFQGYFGRIEDVTNQLPVGSFDLIVLLQVLEHVEAPRLMIKALSELLRPGGVLIIETPNTDSQDARLFKHKYWGGYHFPRHWNMMNKKSLTHLAQEHSLEIKAFNYLPSHSFWIFSFHHWIEDKFGIKWLADLFNPFQNLILLSIFTTYDMIRAKVGVQTSNIQMVVEKS